MLRKKSGHRNEKPLRFSQSGHCLLQLEKSLHSNEEKINKIIKKKKKRLDPEPGKQDQER